MNAARGQAIDLPDAHPESDCLEGFHHPRYTQELFGHDQAIVELVAAFSGGKPHHAWLFEGPDGVGKATLAYHLIKSLFRVPASVSIGPDGLSFDPDATSVRQVEALAHPNLLLLRRPWQEKAKKLASEITIGEVRRLRGFLARTASDGGWRAVIIDRADELNMAAANGLLKSLEEPPERCVFILISAAPGRLPVTIRSRCRRLKFSPLADTELLDAVRNAYSRADKSAPEDAEISACLALAQGSVARALTLLEGGGTDLHKRILHLLAGLPRLDQKLVHGLSDDLAGLRASKEYELFFELLLESLARIVSQATTGQGAIGEEADISQRLAGSTGLAKFAGLWETIRRTKAEADALNLDRKSLVLGTFFKLEETAREAFA